ncbi:MAG: YraN family protein [Methylococcaceae bacterium]|nr:YraN family protein [Methylococcaceae bacterium]
MKKVKAAHLQQGEQSEQRACDYLMAQGLVQVARNYRCRYGELDLIMRDQQQSLVVVEVRYRQSDTYGSALESITARKQSRIIAATHCYLASHPQSTPIRFDVVAISGDNQLNWVKNAFQT